MTTEELLAVPEDGIDRWLIRGQLRQKTRIPHTGWHSRALVRIAYLLESWVEQQPEPKGMVGADAGCRVRRNPDTTVGIDVAYFRPELAAQEPEETSLFDGVPTLAVEILSPFDKQEEIHEKVEEYLDAGVPLVWIVNPRFRTVTVYRPGAEPELFNVNQQISGEPHLPGFQVPVAQMFVR